jgi:hypothetical protein
MHLLRVDLDAAHLVPLALLVGGALLVDQHAGALRVHDVQGVAESLSCKSNYHFQLGLIGFVSLH